jgi:hypothetical protein
MHMRERLTWAAICQEEQLRGHWIALDHCRYDEATLEPIEGELVDADPDLAALCARMRSSDRGQCAVRYCQGVEASDPRRRTGSAERALAPSSH